MLCIVIRAVLAVPIDLCDQFIHMLYNSFTETGEIL